MMALSKRQFVLGVLAGVGAGFIGAGSALASSVKKLVLSESEWRKRLTNGQYYILRRAGTERAFSSPLNNEKRAGIYHCAGCDLALFDSRTKFDSGTGWPSFYDVMPGAVETKTDYVIGFPRTEYHCAKCGGHHGHVFKDGPLPTGLRYCNNGLALKFRAGRKGA